MIRSAAVVPCLILPLMAADSPRLEYALGVLAECRGDKVSAAENYEKARIVDPTAAPLVEIGVKRLLAGGDRADAIRLYQEFAAARSEDLSAQLGYADFLTNQGRDDSLAKKLAIETLEASLAKHPGNPQIIRRLFSLDREKGASLLDGLAADDPESAMLFASLSRSLHDSDNLAARAEIDRRFLLATKTHPENPALAREACEHFRNSGRQDEAIGILERHTNASPWSLDARVRLGILEFSVKRDADGERTLKEVLAIHPKLSLAHQALAKFYRLHDQPEPAAYHAAELLKIRGGSPDEFIKLADEQMAADLPREARLLLEKAVFDHPENAALRMRLAVAAHRDPETRAMSSRLFREAETAVPDGKITDPAFLTESAGALIDSGQSKAGEERLRAAIRAYPPTAKKETAAALRRLAGLWESENRNAEAARALLQRADSLDPK